MKRLPLLLSLLGVIALSASIAYWVLQLYKPKQRQIVAAPVAAVPEPAVDAAATLFGGQAMAAVATNYQLTGVVAAGRDSAAILVADGQPAKAVKVGREVSPGVTVTEVQPRYVMLSEGGVLKRIELAVDAKPAAEMAGPVPMQPLVPQQAQAEPPPPPPTQQEPQEPPAQQQQEGPVLGTPPPSGASGPVLGTPPQGAVNGQAPGAPPPPPPVQMPPPTRTVQGSPPTE